MAGRIKIDVQRCKGCGLCIAACPRKNISESDKTNKKGFCVVEQKGDCNGCALCALICPDAAIEVYRDDTDKGSKSPSKPDLIEEKR